MELRYKVLDNKKKATYIKEDIKECKRGIKARYKEKKV